MKSANTLEKNWSTVSKILFRFTFSYFILFILLLFLALFLETPLRWFADSILNWGTNFKTESTGSGDRTFDYVRFFWKRETLMNTKKMTFFKLDWLNRKAQNLICDNCGHVN